jgi:hypothetical protein
MLPEWMTVGFSGHRQLDLPSKAAEGIRQALDRLAANYGPLAGISSAASGGDTLFLEEAAKRNLPCRILLPFPKARFQKDFSSADWQRVVPLLDKALIVEELAPTESDEEAYYETGALTVERSDVMVFLWDGKAAGGLGGTADIIEYARTLERPLFIVNPSTGNLIEERLEKLPKVPGQVPGPTNPKESVERRFQEMNEVAEHHAPRARRLVFQIILLHLIASAVGLTALVLLATDSPQVNEMMGDIALRVRMTVSDLRAQITHIALVVEILVLLWALYLAFCLRRSHHQWIHHRLGAELCRSCLAVWKLRRQPTFFPRITADGFERLIRSLQIAWYLDRTAACDFEKARNDYITERVEDQMGYYSRHGESAERAFNLWKTVAHSATVVAIVCTALALGFSWNHHEGAPYILTKLSGLLLPLVNAAALSLVISREFSRRFIRYYQMATKLRNVKQQLGHVKSWPTLLRVVTETEDALLDEVVEWHAYLRFAGESH